MNPTSSPARSSAIGQLAMQGDGTLTLGGIDFGGGGSIDVILGTLDVDGPISAGTLQVGEGTFGGLGAWHFSGPGHLPGGLDLQPDAQRARRRHAVHPARQR